ncbi:MAG: hypothetical protein PVF76_09050 [Syntrophobacterales bacterium]
MEKCALRLRQITQPRVNYQEKSWQAVRSKVSELLSARAFLQITIVIGAGSKE